MAEAAEAPAAAAGGAEGEEGPSGPDDEDCLPPEFSDVKPLTDDEFESIGKRIRDLADKHDVEGLQALIAAAIWRRTTREQRYDRIIRELVTGVMELLEQTTSTELKDHLGMFARHLLDAAIRLSLNPQAGETSFHRGKPGAPCVLICGSAGSVLEDLKPQEDFYRSLGFSTVLTTMCLYPVRCKQRMFVRVARCLKEALDNEEPKLLIHSCSGHGCSLVEALSHLWLWSLPPFDKLSALSSCLRGIIWECFSPDINPEIKYMSDDPWLSMRGNDEASREQYADYLLDTAERGDHFEAFGAQLNALNHATDRCMPEWNGKSFVGKHKMASLLMRSVNPSLDPPPAKVPDYGAGLSVWGSMPAWVALELQMYEMKKTVPRMFLYSTMDRLITPGVVEFMIDSQWAYFKSRRITIVVEKCTKSAHMKLFTNERSICEKAVSKFLKVVKLKKV